jgi:hypothetical protein
LLLWAQNRTLHFWYDELVKKALLFAIAIIIVLALSAYLQRVPGEWGERVDEFADVEEQDLSVCLKDSDCIVVQYQHCCGSTKRAINKKYLDLYNSKPEWQTFDGAGCEFIGICPDDSYVTDATCEADDGYQGQCRLQF